MNSKLLWRIALALFALQLVFVYLFIYGLHLIKGMLLFSLAGSILAVILMVFAGAALLGSLLSLMPRKKRPFAEKFRLLFPLMVSILSVFGIAIFGSGAYMKIVNGIDPRPLRNYEQIETPQNLDCNSVHEGKFETTGTVIERWGNIQTETDKITKTKKQFTVKWLSNCEYVIISKENRTQGRKVKITSVKPESYGCYVVPIEYPDEYATFILVKRVK